MYNLAMFRYRYLLIALVALAGSAWIYFTRVEMPVIASAGAQPRANFPAPDFTLAALDGTPVSLNDLRGQVVLINFWATWCPPCRAEMPALETVYQEHRAHKFTVIAINVAEPDGLVIPFRDEFKLTFPILLDLDTAVAKKFQVSGLPTSFFIDRAGIIRATYLGAMNRVYIESQVLPLLETR